jgi:hypothetical protein
VEVSQVIVFVRFEEREESKREHLSPPGGSAPVGANRQNFPRDGTSFSLSFSGSAYRQPNLRPHLSSSGGNKSKSATPPAQALVDKKQIIIKNDFLSQNH